MSDPVDGFLNVRQATSLREVRFETGAAVTDGMCVRHKCVKSVTSGD